MQAGLRAVAGEVAAAIGLTAVAGSGRPLLLTATLFLGPLVMAGLDRVAYLNMLRACARNAQGARGARSADGQEGLVGRAAAEFQCLCMAFGGFGGGLRTVRNLVVAPISEELVFRACCLPLLLAAVRACACRGC